MKTMNNLAWMLLGVGAGLGTYYCYNEFSNKGSLKQTMNKVKKNVGKKLENMNGE